MAYSSTEIGVIVNYNTEPIGHIMKRRRNIAISLTIIAAGLLSGYWISQNYGNPGPVALLSGDGLTWKVVRQVGGDSSAVKMPFFDFKKGS